MNYLRFDAASNKLYYYYYSCLQTKQCRHVTDQQLIASCSHFRACQYWSNCPMTVTSMTMMTTMMNSLRVMSDCHHRPYDCVSSSLVAPASCLVSQPGPCLAPCPSTTTASLARQLLSEADHSEGPRLPTIYVW